MLPNKHEIKRELESVFRPGAPVNSYELFAGRLTQVQNIVSAIRSRGQHVALFGERGVGKTSLANVLAELLGNNKNLAVIKTTASRGDTFNGIWGRIGRELRFENKKQGIGFLSQNNANIVNLEELLTNANSPDDVRYHLGSLRVPIVAVIDEFDRLAGTKTTQQMADCIKTFSDNAVDVTIVLVGVADDINELIAEHASVERALVQVRMPRMTHQELHEIIDKGCKATGMVFTQTAVERCVSLAQGLPHYTHLLALLSATAALDEDSLTITDIEVDKSIKAAIERAQQSVQNLYHRATSSPRTDNLFREVLTACALARTDQLGYFAPSDVRSPLSKIMGKSYDIPAFARHLKLFCDTDRGPILQRTGPQRRYRYRFINPLMQPYVILAALASKKIDSSLASTVSQ